MLYNNVKLVNYYLNYIQKISTFKIVETLDDFEKISMKTIK